ncbi:DUF4251 domain-containing protein [Mangrovibacterium marinum]|uniref:Uncharacterized protein DUF4251 n=1 Tax=Mangrovibacterium marinum TaxID=1639118 RepID=A0A2T5BYD9_9BACT|nr:DUF4251 domain-containing protein [Mangrovibacterium marinum]PTN07228.1 uncharacterized protein DUF4251 [Mangrovibacterium marinum]
MKALGIILALLFFAVLPGAAQQQQNKKEAKAAEIAELVKSGDFIFIARSATPVAGSQIILTSIYTMSFHGDTVEAYLPYYGRAYQAPYEGTDGGIKFKEVVAEKQELTKKRKQLYVVSFDVSTARENYKVFLTVGSGGYADLQITPTHRQVISYYGHIEALPSKE